MLCYDFTPERILELVYAECNHSQSVRFLKALQQHPNQPFDPTVLRHAENLEYYCNELEFAVMNSQYEHINCGLPDSKYPVIDARTIAECKKFLCYLNAKLEEARGHEDTELLAYYQEIKDYIVSYLLKATDDRGKPYNFQTQRENDRRCVYRALSRLLETVSKHHPQAGAYLKAHLVMDAKFMWRE